MRYHDFNLSEEQLNELRMGPSDLRAFANSPEAEGIQAGFEAELIFPGLGDSDGGEAEEDMDLDEYANSVDDIISFFSNDDYGYGISDREERNLRNQLDDEWMQYFDDAMYDAWHGEAQELIRDVIENTDWDEDERIQDYLENQGLDSDEVDYVISVGTRNITNTDGSEEDNQRYTKAIQLYKDARNEVANELNARAEESLKEQDQYYEEALDEFRDGFSGVSEADWLHENYPYMSDIADSFGLSWPYIRYEGSEGGYDEYQAQNLADSLAEAIGMKVVASSGYHNTSRKPGLWIIESDSSLEGNESDDMPAEIVSPPMPLTQCLDMLDKFWTWADKFGAYTNRSTGFHMGVSLPTTGGKVDFIKLALFLGDEHVLKEFGRLSNNYTEAAMKKIRNKVGQNPTQATDALNLMRNGLIELATKSMDKIAGSQKSPGFGKYTSINPKDNYIEFRSAGGEDYNKDIKKLQNTLIRYAQAMSIASNPSAERKEYYKKLYKLISPSGGNSALDLFARYSTGNISKEELKTQWAEAALAKEAPQEQQKSTWEVIDKRTGQALPGIQYSGYTEAEAKALAKQAISPASSWRDFQMSFNDRYELRNVSASTGKWAIINRDTGETLDIVDSPYRGTAADLAMEKYFNKGIYVDIEPVPSDTPKPKLSRRAELAKRIKEPKQQERERVAQQTSYTPPDDGDQRSNWNIIDNNTREVVRTLTNTTYMGAQHVARTENELAGRDQYRATYAGPGPAQVAQGTIERQPQQVVTDAGIPMWEIYVRETGQAVNRFPDHNQTAAWSTAQGWLRDAHAPESTWNAYSIRPLMSQPTTFRPQGTTQAGQPATESISVSKNVMRELHEYLDTIKLPKGFSK